MPFKLAAIIFYFIGTLSGRYFLARGDDIKNKRKVSPFLFFFLYPFISVALHSFLYFLLVYMAWKRPGPGCSKAD